MEIDITNFFRDAYPADYSASVAERGNNVGKETWQAAIEAADTFMLIDTDEKRDALRKHVHGFGAWDQKEIDSWTDVECNALFIQLVSGDIRDAGLDTVEPDWEAYNEGANAGRISGSIGPASDGTVYYYLGD